MTNPICCIGVTKKHTQSSFYKCFAVENLGRLPPAEITARIMIKHDATSPVTYKDHPGRGMKHERVREVIRD